VGGRLTALAVDPSDPDHILLGGDMLGIANSDDGGRSWQRSVGLLSLEVSRFTFHPDVADEIWVGTMSGPHVSTDGGQTWTPRREGLPDPEDLYYSAPVETVIVDRSDSDRLLAFGGSHREWDSPGEPAWGAVWESTDHGLSWSRLATIADGTNLVAAVQQSDGTLLAAALRRGVHRSTDGGRTWAQSDSGLPHGNVRDLAIVPGTTIVYAALGEGPVRGSQHTTGGIYRSIDGGLTWENRSDGLGDRPSSTAELTSRYQAVAVSSVDPDTIWTADLAFGIEAIYRSDDAGDSWRVELLGDGEDDLPTAYSSPATAEVLLPDPERNELMFAAQSEYVLHRTEDGQWIDATSIPTAAGSVGTGFSGLVATAVTFNPAVPGDVSLNALDGGQHLRSTDWGESWVRPITSWDQWGGSQSMSIAGPSGENAYVLLGQFGVFNGIAVSTDGQNTWTFAAGSGAGLPERFDFVGSLDDIRAFPDEPTRAVATIGGAVYVTTDGGSTWTRALSGSYSALAIAPGGELFAADDGAVHQLTRTADDALKLPDSPPGVDTLTVDPSTGFLYAVRWGVDDNSDGLIARWDGTAWTQLCLEVSCGPGLDRYAAHIAVDPTNPDHLIVATNDLPFHDEIGARGVLESTDGGETWTTLGDGLTVARVSVVEFDPHHPDRVLIGTMGGGFFEIWLGGER
jgi:photosystem II stability/assembly factor-like uncharacterized protein